MSVDILNQVTTHGAKKCIPVRDLIKDIKSKIDNNPDILLQEIADDFNNQSIYNTRGRPYTAALISWGTVTYLGESYRRNEKHIKTIKGIKSSIDNSSQISEGIKVESFKKKNTKVPTKILKPSSSLNKTLTDDLVKELVNRGYKVTLNM